MGILSGSLDRLRVPTCPYRRALQPGAAAAELPIKRARVALPHRARRPVGERRFFAIVNV